MKVRAFEFNLLNFRTALELNRKIFLIFCSDFLHTLLRSRRSVNQPENLLDEFAYRPKYEFNKPNGYFEHKVYGNDINFLPFNDFSEFQGVVKRLVPLERIKDIFSSKRENFINSGTLVDVS